MGYSALVGITIGAAGLLQVGQRDQVPVFRADVDLHTVHVAVVDTSGAPVDDLGAADLSIVEDGEERQVAFVIPAREAPLDVAVVLDISASMATFMPYAREDLHRFLDQLSERDCVLFVSFRDDVAQTAWAPPHHSDLRALVTNSGTVGFTGLFAGLGAALSELAEARTRSIVRELSDPVSSFARAPDVPRLGECPPPDRATGEIVSRRRALVLISDGGNTGPDRAEESVTVAALAGVPIYAIGAEDEGVPPRGRPETFDAGRQRLPSDRSFLRAGPGGRGNPMANVHLMRYLAESTGGSFISGRDWGLERVLSWLRGTYLVAYHGEARADAAPGVDFAAHAVEVRMLREDTVAVVQPDYYRPTFDPYAGRPALEQAKQLLAGGEAAAALPELETAIAQDARRSESHFQRALALAQLDRPQEALESARRATHLDAGVGAAHYLVAVLAAEVADYDTAWRELLNAHQAGYDISRLRLHLEESAPPPELFRANLDAPRLLVHLSATPADLQHVRAYADAARAVRRVLSREPSVGLVVQSQLADFFLAVVPRDVAARERRMIPLDLELRDREGMVHRDVSLSLRLGDNATSSVEIRHLLSPIVDWLARDRDKR